MSDSRLEKFIYAICSMDVSDLPVPLSRIEKLWNCLITGETPDFEPLSRNEKYLMAMLDHYDISNLPAPMSRGEKLLYKIAVGETDLSDVPGYLSRYEELLKYLIENGGIGFEYVLYTLNQSLSTLYSTAEKPVKSAILKGNTLVNLLNGDNIEQRPSSNTSAICGYDKETRTFHFITNLSHPYSYSYISTYNADKNGVARHLKNNTDYTIMWYGEKIRDDDDSQTFIKVGASSSAYGDPNYFTNVVNIKTGKMLYRTQTSYEDSIVRLLGIRVFNVSNDIEYKLRFVILEGDYTNFDIPYFDGMQSVKMPVLTTSNEDGTKTNILSTPSDLELRGIGKGSSRVEDELDCLTGEVVERIGEITLDGSQKFIAWGGYGFYMSDSTLTSSSTSQCINNKYPSYINASTLSKATGNGIAVNSGKLYIKINEFTDVNEFVTYLKSNPITVQYQLATESIKTVDLTTVDQDGQATKLKTFNDITHVEIKADNLIPSVDVEVATKISETLATLDPQQLNISETQNKLGQTIEEQTENTDATMMATTEIYEQTL